MFSIIHIVQRSKFLYYLYYGLGSIMVSFLKLWVKPDPKLIVFNSFGGKKYDDSPRAIYLEMIIDKRFKGYKFVWAFNNPDSFSIPVGEKVKIDTLNYFRKVLKARIWITNTSMTRALRFEGINTLSINTWHGTAIKMIGIDARKGGSAFVPKVASNSDIYLAQGEYDRAIFSRAFGIPEDRIKVIGLPRNDELIDVNNQGHVQIIKTRLSIPSNKTVILYAPTFREYEREGSSYIINLPMNLIKWQEELGDNYVLLLRAHHSVVKSMGVIENDYVRDVSCYPKLNDLMIVSDILISDYSSIFFDYSILGKPMLCYSYDYSRYERERGLYFDIRKELANEDLNTEDRVIEALKTMDVDERIRVSNAFRKKYVEAFGNASRNSLDLIFSAIN